MRSVALQADLWPPQPLFTAARAMGQEQPPRSGLNIAPTADADTVLDVIQAFNQHGRAALGPQ